MNKLNSLQDFNNFCNNLNSNNEGKTIIKVGMGTCGIASGADDVYKTINEEITKRNLDNIVVESVGCIGECYNEPIVEVNGNRYAKVNSEMAVNIIANLNSPSEYISNSEGQVRIALENCGKINPDKIEDYIAHNGYKALAKVLFNMTKEEVVEEIKASGLRGRGGAGFPTGIKWEATKNAIGDKKYIVCNADEGDPGAFMDRALLEGDPHRVIEAMTIAGFTCGADEGIFYIRAEYPLAVKRLNTAIKQAEEYGLLGSNILGTDFSFKFSISLGAGAFVCGEETALLNSIEGLRGEPRVKPPFPAQKGLKQQPTNINNVETYANICPIILNGSAWFNTIGTEKSKGTKVFALAGKINNVGLIEVPMGTPLKKIIYEIGGGIKNNKEFKAMQTGGPSGGCIPSSMLDIPIDYESLRNIGSIMGSGGMIVMDEDDCMVDIAKYYLDFTVDESCGKCTPCRIGNLRLYEMLEKITNGNGSLEDIDDLIDLGQVIKDTSLCGLGQSSPNPVLSTIEHFKDEYIEHIRDHKCRAGKCSAFVGYYINPEKCIGCTKCAKVCPVPCIEGELKVKHSIIQEKCIKCGSCFAACPVKAIEKR